MCNRTPASSPALGIALALLLSVPSPGLADDIVYTLEAQFLERFTRFIEWPAGSTVADASVPFLICVIGKSDIQSPLEEVAKSTEFKGKQAEVRKISELAAIDQCQILVIAGSERRQLDEILAQTEGKPILTVGDTAGFAAAGVMINFISEDVNVRFEVNSGTASDSGLRLADKLLSLAAEVIDSKKP